MPPRLRVFYSLLITVLLLIPAIALTGEFSRRADIWWTPLPLALSLADSKERVEIYVGGKPLAALVEHGQVAITDAAGSHVLTAKEIGLRFNNRDRIRAQRLPLLLLYAAACGGGAVLLLLLATGGMAYKGEHEAVAG